MKTLTIISLILNILFSALLGTLAYGLKSNELVIMSSEDYINCIDLLT